MKFKLKHTFTQALKSTFTFPLKKYIISVLLILLVSKYFCDWEALKRLDNDTKTENLSNLSEFLAVRSMRLMSPIRRRHIEASEFASRIFVKDQENSFIANYEKIPTLCASRPHRPYILHTLSNSNPLTDHTRRVKKLVQSKDSLLVISTTSDEATELQRSIKFVTENMKINHLVFLQAKDSHCVRCPAVTGIQLRKLVARVDLQQISGKGVAADMKLASTANALLVHGYEEAALIALCGRKTVYFSNVLVQFASSNLFRWAIPDLRPTSHGIWGKNEDFLDRFSEMGPVKPSCCDFQTVGVRDDEKVVCSNGIFNYWEEKKAGDRLYPISIPNNNEVEPHCWVLSLGCGGKWNFEQGVVEKTKCVVQTFDCTEVFHVPVALQARVTLHKICVGLIEESRSEFQSLRKIIELGSHASGFSSFKAPVLMKMDVEGWEYLALPQFLTHENEVYFPDQILLELHALVDRRVWPYYVNFSQSYSVDTTPSIKRLFNNISAARYDILHRADNPYCAHCTEITLMRKAALPPKIRKPKRRWFGMY